MRNAAIPYKVAPNASRPHHDRGSPRADRITSASRRHHGARFPASRPGTGIPWRPRTPQHHASGRRASSRTGPSSASRARFATVAQLRRLDCLSRRRRPLSPGRLLGLPVGPPRGSSPASSRASRTSSACPSSTRSATGKAGPSPAGSSPTLSTAGTLLGEAYDATDPDFRRALLRCRSCGTRRPGTSSTTSPATSCGSSTRGLRRPSPTTASCSHRPSCWAEIDSAQRRAVYDNLLTTPVYQAGFTTSQAAYESTPPRASTTKLVELDGPARRPPLSCSATSRARPTGACSPRSCASTPSTPCHFKCSLRARGRLPEPLALPARPLPATRDRRDGQAPTRSAAHYYGTHTDLNPHRIIALPPAAALNAPHSRAALGAASAA